MGLVQLFDTRQCKARKAMVYSMARDTIILAGVRLVFTSFTDIRSCEPAILITAHLVTEGKG